MFSSLRQNSQIYVLHKGNEPRLEIGYVTGVSIPKPKYTMPQAFTQQEMVVDLNVKLGDVNAVFNNVSANVDITDSFCNNECVTLSTSREAMNSEINNLKQKSVDIVNSIDIHKKLIESYDVITMDLNPDYAEKIKQKGEMDELKNQVSGMQKSIDELLEANRVLMEQLKKGN